MAIRLPLALALTCSLLAGIPTVVTKAAAFRTDEDTVRLTNRGVGLMEQYRFSDAAAMFEQVVQRAPRWAAAHVNLGIAYLNAVSDPDKPGGSLDLAGAAFDRAAELDPSLPHPQYCLGILARYRGDSDAALERFRRVLEIDPHNADSLHFIGAIMLSRGEAEEAAEYFRRAIDEHPYLLSAHYSLAQALIRMGEREEAMARLELFQQLDAANVGVKRAIVYTEMGEYADAMRVFPPASDAPEGRHIDVTFVPADVGLTSRSSDAGDVMGHGFALADIDGDGDLDVFAPQATGGWNRARDGFVATGNPYLFENIGGRFTERAFPVTARNVDVELGLFGDYDNDGDSDLFAAASDGWFLFRNDGDFVFTDVTDEAGLAGGAGGGVRTAVWVDADHEGDLDLLLLTVERGVVLFRNNSDGTFLDVSAESGLPAADIAYYSVGIADFDEDTDVDFLFVSDRSPPRLYLNDRLNRWSDATAASGLRQEKGGLCALTADFDRDGDSDVLLLRGTGSPALFYRNVGKGRFQAEAWPRSLRGSAGAILDFDNDGDLDVFLASAGWDDDAEARPVLLENDGDGAFKEVHLEELEVELLGPAVGADVDDDGDSDLVVARYQDGPIILRNDGGNANRWLHIELEGVMANRSGYGAKVEIKSGSLWQKIEHHMIGGAANATNPRIEIGLGRRQSVDFVRIVWPNGVLQSELEVASNQLRVIREVQRKASSCPILFAWNGDRFEFVTDFMGVGGLGFFVEPGVTAAPDPTERVKLEHEQLAPTDGEYRFRIMEPMEEISYVDAIRLLAVDHPAGTDIYPDERLALDGVVPTTRIYVQRERVKPIRATDAHGRDVLDRILTRDRRYPPLSLDERFLGFLDGEHTLEVDFGDRIRDLDESKPWILHVYGWIEYPYSHVVYSALQAGVSGEGLHIDVRQPDGTWETVRPNVGYPAGMPKMMTVDMSPHMSHETTAVRFRTNLEIYIDELYLAEDLGENALHIHELDASRATLRFTGYPRESSPDGRLPRLYDYTSMDRSYAFKNMAGRYTRLGDVRELLMAADDLYVVMGRGEEITVAFEQAHLPPVPDAYVRTFILDTDGFCKDMDAYTSYPDTVGPLPFHAMSGYPYPASEAYPDTDATRAFFRSYQTRAK